MSKVLELQGVTRHFATPDGLLKILDGVDLTLAKGEIVGLLGSSGSGKTTLLQIAGLLANPTGGTLRLMGEEVAQADDAKRTQLRRDCIGFVYQFHLLLPEFSALENVVLPQLVAGAEEKTAQRKAAELLDELGLASRKHHMPSALSGGEQQRVAIARALANDAPLLLADEPTGNLDAGSAETVFAKLMALVAERQMAALIATHNEQLAARMHRMVRLEKGRLV